ncbi:hypothetical protein HMPREF0578_0597 [Mobiluncus mulieris 28-1]|nr:hypothetical protein HMPREF0577_1963 [Mobiluncus mulieris ATCC 35243]EEZ90631.1 hypothetical protein HMPREF0578_0597 [Mobiluncus mulieris 28-1]
MMPLPGSSGFLGANPRFQIFRLMMRKGGAGRKSGTTALR